MKKIIEFLRWSLRNIDTIASVVLVFAVSIISLTQNINEGMILSTILLVLGVLSVSILRDREESKKIKDTLQNLQENNTAALLANSLLRDQSVTGIERVLPNFINFNWISELRNIRHLVIAKMKMDFTENPEYYKELERLLGEGGSVTLIVSDPRSPALWMRYHDEADRSRSHSEYSETAWVGGVQDLVISLHHLYTWREKLVKNNVETKKLSIKVNPHYPTQAYYKFDNRIYVFDYAFHERGFHSPVFLFSNPETATFKFLNKCVNEIINYSIPVQDVFSEIWEKNSKGFFSEQKVSQAKIVIK